MKVTSASTDVKKISNQSRKRLRRRLAKQTGASFRSDPKSFPKQAEVPSGQARVAALKSPALHLTE